MRYMMNTDYLDRDCMQRSQGEPQVPHGYILHNGVVIVWTNGNRSNTMVNETRAREMFPNLVIVHNLETEQPTTVA